MTITREEVWHNFEIFLIKIRPTIAVTKVKSMFLKVSLYFQGAESKSWSYDSYILECFKYSRWPPKWPPKCKITMYLPQRGVHYESSDCSLKSCIKLLVYRKKSHTGQYLNFSSHDPLHTNGQGPWYYHRFRACAARERPHQVLP